jgi:hypothetical protein
MGQAKDTKYLKKFAVSLTAKDKKTGRTVETVRHIHLIKSPIHRVLLIMHVYFCDSIPGRIPFRREIRQDRQGYPDRL